MTVDSPTPQPLRVDFYVLGEASDTGRLKLACRVVEKAYLAGQRVALLCADGADLQSLDELLWTFAEGSFVPHERAGASDAADAAQCPVILSAGVPPPMPVDIVVNLSPEVPPAWPGVGRIAEIVDGAEARRTAGRARFRHYRSIGVEPQTHNM